MIGKRTPLDQLSIQHRMKYLNGKTIPIFPNNTSSLRNNGHRNKNSIRHD